MKKLVANSFLLMFLFGMLVTPIASVSLLKIQSNQEVLSAHSKTVDVDENKDNEPLYYDIRDNSIEETTQSTN